MKKYGKKRVFSSQYFIEYLPSISASENPMVGLSAIKKSPKSPPSEFLICCSTLNSTSFGANLQKFIPGLVIFYLRITILKRKLCVLEGNQSL